MTNRPRHGGRSAQVRQVQPLITMPRGAAAKRLPRASDGHYCRLPARRTPCGELQPHGRTTRPDTGWASLPEALPAKRIWLAAPRTTDAHEPAQRIIYRYAGSRGRGSLVLPAASHLGPTHTGRRMLLQSGSFTQAITAPILIHPAFGRATWLAESETVVGMVPPARSARERQGWLTRQSRN